MKFLEGKKTYLVAGLLVLLGVYLGVAVDPTFGVSVILMGLGMTTLGAKANRHQREILDALQAAHQIAIEKKPLTTDQKTQLATDGVGIAMEVAANSASTGGAARD